MKYTIHECGDEIPKIIHYCWFGGKPLPANLQACVDSWSKLEGYTVMRWDETNCSFDENEFVRYTYENHMLGFIGDYYRLKSIYEYGGIYLDTDVKINKSFDPLLKYPCFLNFITDCSVGSAIIGSKPGNPFIKSLLDWYDITTFGKNEDGRVFNFRDGKLIVNPMHAVSNYYYTYYILKHYPSFRLNNKFQDLKDFVIFPKELFEIGSFWGNHYAVHLCAGVWIPNKKKGSSSKEKIKYLLAGNPFVYDKIQSLVRKRRYRKMKKRIPFYGCYLAQRKNEKLPEI